LWGLFRHHIHCRIQRLLRLSSEHPPLLPLFFVPYHCAPYLLVFFSRSISPLNQVLSFLPPILQSLLLLLNDRFHIQIFLSRH
jgi:hypothetical protein